jgi:Type IV secretion-system coupling protein DNA-binding domain
MAAVVSIVLGGAAILSVVLGWRWLDARAWRGQLVALRLQFPRGLRPDAMSGWLGMLGSLRVVVALEVVARRDDVSHYLLVPKTRQADLVTGTRAVLPGLRVEEAPEYLERRAGPWRAATELRITHLSHSLAADRAEGAAAAFLGSLAQLAAGEEVRVQWLLMGVRTPGPRRADDPARELKQAEKVKHSAPLLQAVGRVAVAAPPGRAGALLSRIVGTLRLLDAPGVAVVRRPSPYWWAGRRLMLRAWPLSVWPMTINVREAAGLVGVPLGDAMSIPGLVLGRSRQLPPGPVPSRGGTTVAVSNYPGRTGQPLVIRPEDRLRHLYVVGPTGVGKSNLLAQLAIQDATAGHGLVLVDPKSDLVETVLERLPEGVAERVIVLDPAQTDRPVGFNPLAVPGADEHARELAADRVLHIFKDLYRASWGPRSDDLLRAALLTLVSVPAPNGAAFTLCEVPELLTRPALRRYALGRAGLPEALGSYWMGFDAMSEAEQLQHIGPVMNKLRAFTMRTATRLMLGQSTGIDLAEVMRKRQILLVSLAKGKLGTETATLAGSLLVAALWQAVLGRANVVSAARWPFFLFLDEFQDVVRLSEGLPDLLSQARGFGVGAVLANQYAAQLPESVRAAVLGTVRSQVAFQVEYDDARLLERRFAPSLAADDLMGLERFEVAIRASVDGTTATPVTGVTLPLSEPVREAATLAEAARERFGRARAEVEADLKARVEMSRGQAARPGRSYRRRAT